MEKTPFKLKKKRNKITETHEKKNMTMQPSALTELVTQSFHRLDRQRFASRTEMDTVLQRTLQRISPHKLLEAALVTPKETKNCQTDIDQAESEQTYNNTTKVTDLVKLSLQQAAIARYSVDMELCTLLELLFQKGGRPDPHLFDGILIRDYSKPIIHLRNESVVGNGGYMLFLELRHVRRFVDDHVSDSYTATINERQLHQIDAAVSRSKRQENMFFALTVGVVTFGIFRIIAYSAVV